MPKKTIRIVAVSDTHTFHNVLKIPECDIFIHSGDFTNIGEFKNIINFNTWVKTVPAKHKILIAGNHDRSLQLDPGVARNFITNCIYLEDESVTIEGLKIYGSPFTPSFNRHYWAFNADRGDEIKKHWDMIPEDTNILVTHGPPANILDGIPHVFNGEEQMEHVGCQDLLDRIIKVTPRLHICGHIHESYGSYKTGKTLFVNASICNAQYQPVNAPVVIEITENDVKII